MAVNNFFLSFSLSPFFVLGKQIEIGFYGNDCIKLRCKNAKMHRCETFHTYACTLIANNERIFFSVLVPRERERESECERNKNEKKKNEI